MNIFSIEEVKPHIQRIRTPFGVGMYLIHGNDKSLLIDTGMGVGDLKRFVDAHTDHSYDVLITHGHCDHAGGASGFENVYLNPIDWQLEKRHATLEHRIHDVFQSPFGVVDGIRETDFVPQRTKPYLSVREGDVFDLGGIHVSLIALPGHTHGILVPLIKEERTAIIGDALGENSLLHFPESTSIETYRKSLLHLKEYEDQFETCLRFHGNGVSDKKILDDTIELCDLVLKRQDAKIPARMMEYDGLLARPKEHPGKAGNFIYNPDKLFQEDEDHEDADQSR